MGLRKYNELVTILSFELHGHSSVHEHWQFGYVYSTWHLTSGKMYQDLPLFIVGRVSEWGCSHLHKTCTTYKIYMQLNYVPKIEASGEKLSLF